MTLLTVYLSKVQLLRFTLTCTLALLILPYDKATAQLITTTKTVIPHQQAWFGYMNQTRFSTKWGLWTDIHLRRTDFLDRWSQVLVRVGATHYLADHVRLTAGYAYAETYPAHNQLVRPEHRPWQQIWWTSRWGRLNMIQWIRTEQRFLRRLQGEQLGDGYRFNWRFRYNLQAQMPLWGEPVVRPGVLNLVLQNEVFVNAGRDIIYNTFDQNRFFAGFSYPVNRALSVQAGYMNQFIQTTVGNTYDSNHTARLFLFHNLDFRRQR